jgi:hypothetical protein
MMVGSIAKSVANIIAKRVLGEKLENNFGKDDAYFESVPATDLNNQKGSKNKKVKRALPTGLSQNDTKVLTKVKRRAHRLDSSINFCGIKVGWGSVIGIVPGFGDALDAFMAYMVISSCRKIDGGLPKAIYSKMMLNLIIDFLVGLVPFIGDLGDALFRCNTKNAILLEKYLAGDIDKNGHAVKRRKPTTRLEDDVEMRPSRRNEPLDGPPEYSAHPQDRCDDREPRRPERVKTSKSGKKGWFFGGRDSGRDDRDLEEGPEYEYRPAQPQRP